MERLLWLGIAAIVVCSVWIVVHALTRLQSGTGLLMYP